MKKKRIKSSRAFASIPSQTSSQPKEASKGDLLIGDIAYTNALLRWSFSQYNPDDLVSKKGISIFTKMLTDDQVKAGIHIRKFPIIASGYSIDAVSDEPIDVEIRDFIEFALDNIKGTFNEKILNIMSCITYGFSLNEILFAILPPSYPFPGKMAIADIKSKHPEQVDFHTDPYGNLIDILQMNDPIRPLQKFIVASYDKCFENYYGTSALRSCYIYWFSKDINLKFWNMANERFGMPTVKGTYEKNVEHVRSKLESVVNNLQSKAGVVLPTGADISFLEAGRSGSSPYEAALTYFDRAIARSLLIPSSLGFSPMSNTGSLAQSKTHFSSFINWVVKPDRVFFSDIINEQIVKRLVMLNYPNVTEYPVFRFNPMSALEENLIADVWIKAIQGGAVQSDLDDENTFRRLINFPERIGEKEDEGHDTVPEIDAANKSDGDINPDGDAGDIDKQALPKDGEEEESPVGYSRNIPYRDNKYFAASEASKRIDFARVERDMDSLESKSKDALKKVLVSQRDSMLKKVRRLDKDNRLNAPEINKLTMPSSTVGAYQDMLVSAFQGGQKLALSLIPKKYKKDIKTFDVQVMDLKPKAAMKHFKDSAFTVSKVQDDQILAKVKFSILKDIEHGTALQEMMNNVEKIFDEYIENPAVKGELTTGFRLETIIRTNSTRAFAGGMLNTYRQDDVKKVIPGVEYSAVLDSRTTDICNYLHGKQFKNTDTEVDRFTPPNHFNCRSIWIPIFIDEPLSPISPDQINKAKGLVGKGFY